MLIIDVQHIYYRYWYKRGSLDPFYTVAGKNIAHVKATYDKCLEIIEDYGFRHMVDESEVCICCDLADTLLRKEKHPEYKANREDKPDQLTYENRLEIRNIVKKLRGLGATVYAQKGLEADDLVYSLVKDNPEKDKVVYTSDRDLLMLVDEKTTVYILSEGGYIPVFAHTYEKRVGELMKREAKYNDMVIYKSLAGDPSDNIKGVVRYGVKKYSRDIEEKVKRAGVEIPRTKAGMIKFIRHFELNEKQEGEFMKAIEMVYPYYCKGLARAEVVDLERFKK